MKKKIALLTLAIMLISTAVFATGNMFVVETDIQLEPISFTPSFDSLASYMGYDTDEKFETFHKTALFMGKYCPTKESFSYVEQMILSGCDPQTTMDIYQFYLTTNENISIVRQIYDMVYFDEPIMNRDAVFEAAFNEITNNKCGVLTKEDISAYLEQGLTIEDILQANVLSRKGVLTIQQILDNIIAGKSWEEIVETISGETISTAKSTADAATLINAIQVSSATGKTLNATLLSDEKERLATSTKNTNAILQKKGYWRARTSDNIDTIIKMAEAKGITEDKIMSLLNQGYSEIDVINTIEQPDCTALSVDSVAKREADN